MAQDNKSERLSKAHTHHPRQFRGSTIVYPVLSRRSGGISIGINLSPEKICNFECIYCQVDRSSLSSKQPASSLYHLEEELTNTIKMVISGDIYKYQPFDSTPKKFRRLNDIAFSGDGEPTAETEFLPACRILARLREDLGIKDVKTVLITNSTMLSAPRVQEALAIMDNINGEIWAKLDAGTEEYYKQVNNSGMALEKIIFNIKQASAIRPIVIQTLFMAIDGKEIASSEVDAYIQRLIDITNHGGKIKQIQLHTIARKPRTANVSKLPENTLKQIADKIHNKTNIPITAYPA